MTGERMDLSGLRGFAAERMDPTQRRAVEGLAARARMDVLDAIARAGSGHPGGALSSMDIYATLWLCARVAPGDERAPERDRIVVSHGHTAAGLYAVLGNLGFFDIEEFRRGFRTACSAFEGHPGLRVPGVEWCSGSLGQGLSVGCGFALGLRQLGSPGRVFVVLGDGEQAKGQIGEARELAAKYRLGNLIAIVDCNGLQASGTVAEILPQGIEAKYAASGWRVCHADGHDPAALYQALRSCCGDSTQPTVILARTIMGKGVSFLENRFESHGRVLKADECARALEELRPLAEANPWQVPERGPDRQPPEPVERRVLAGQPLVYAAGRTLDCRAAFGAALNSLAAANRGRPGAVPTVLDCDLLESLRLREFRRDFPAHLIECGIQEHNAATVAAALSRAGVLTFFADFGVFAVDETYGQHRMSDLNATSLKLVATHCGVDVGEDGKTHQCVDAVGLLANLWGFQVLAPADANQTDRMVRYAATTPGNVAILMGRSPCPVLTDAAGRVLFGEGYEFRFGQADWIRAGDQGTIVSFGHMVWRAARASDSLRRRGVRVGVLNLACPVELDAARLREAAATGLVITYEDHNERTGIGAQVGAFLAESGIRCRFRRMGLRRYGLSATPDCQYEQLSLTAEALEERVLLEMS